MYFYQKKWLFSFFAKKFLQVQGKFRPLIKYERYNHFGDGSTFLFIPTLKNRKLKKQESLELNGSMTLEAAFVLPIFMLVMVSVMHLIMLLNFQTMLHTNLENTANEIVMKYIDNQESKDVSEPSVIDELYVWNQVMHEDVKKVKERLGIYNLFITLDSDLEIEENKDGIYQLCVTYSVPIPLISKHIYRLRFADQCCFRAFIGSEMEQEQKAELVYITERGTVYHLYEDCTHIHLSILEVTYEAVSMLRNTNGERYKKCEKCIHSQVQSGEILKITTDGNRYHRVEDCAGIKRMVQKVEKDSVKNLPLCKRCKEREEKMK